MTKAVTKTAQPGISKEKLIDFLEFNGIAKGLTNEEKGKFIETALAFNLDPFKREIHVNKYGNDFSIVVGYEVYIKRAEATGLLKGWSVRTEGSVNRQNPAESDLKAIITIHRKDWEMPFEWEVYFSEFAKLTREGRITQFWQRARFMTTKVAIGQGFRLCFSECAGLPYTEYEDEKPLAEMVEEAREDAEIVQAAQVMYEEREKAEAISSEVAEVEIIDSLDDLINEAREKISRANNDKEVAAVWRMYPEIQHKSEFVQICKNRKLAINGKTADIAN